MKTKYPNLKFLALVILTVEFLTPSSTNADSIAVSSREEKLVNYFVKPGNPKVQGALDSLNRNGKLYTRSSDARYQLVYFGTSHRIGSCAADLLLLQRAIESLEIRCGADVARYITPILVYPEYEDNAELVTQNLDMYINAPNAKIIGLSGSISDVAKIAAGYKANYVLEPNGVVKSHTRHSYLMAPDGSNLAVFLDGTPFGIIADEIILSLQRDGLLEHSVGAECSPDW